MSVRKEEKIPEPVKEKAALFTKSALTESEQFRAYRDVLEVLLEKDQSYEKEQVYQILKDYLEREVR